jgi:hypothetical protein
MRRISSILGGASRCPKKKVNYALAEKKNAAPADGATRTIILKKRQQAGMDLKKQKKNTVAKKKHWKKEKKVKAKRRAR